MIQIDKLGFSYGKIPVLNHITMTLQPGKIYGLLGENGVGKTTLLTLLCGLKKTTDGSIRVDGIDPYKRDPDLLADQYYLADDVLPIPEKASSFAKTTGSFWPNYSHDKFLEIMALFENDPEKKMNAMSTGQLKRPTFHWRWHSDADTCISTSRLTVWIFRPRPSSGARL